MKTYIYLLNILVLAALTSNQLQGQTSGDSLSFAQVLDTVLRNHPSVKQAEEAINAADARIAMARAGKYPMVDASAAYSHIGPVPIITFPGLGEFHFYPANNYSAALNYNQTVYDFGKTNQSINVEKENKTLVSQNVDLAKRRLSMSTVNAYYMLVYLQKAIVIKEEQLQTLRSHLEWMEKKQASGSATKYEVLTTKVKISNIENQKLDLETAKTVQIAILNSLMGTQTAVTVKLNVSTSTPTVPDDSLLVFAYNHRIEVIMAKEKESVAALQYQVAKAQDNASINVFASAGGKNGYIPDLNTVKFNYAAGVNVKVPIYDGNRKKSLMAQAQTGMNTTGFETELMRRNIANEVVESKANSKAAYHKIAQSELQVAQATEAFALANVNYKAGAITNLDLLDAETSVSESKLLLLRSQIDYQTSLLRLRLSIGDVL